MVRPMICPSDPQHTGSGRDRKFVQTRMAIEQRADAEKQEIYRRLRGG